MIYLLCHSMCKCFIPFLENFEFLLQKNNIKAVITHCVTEYTSDDDLWIVIWNDLDILPLAHCIIYNMDPMVKHIENAFKELLKRSDKLKILKIVDYSYGLNLNYISNILCDLGLNIPLFHMPYGYSSYHKYQKKQICGNEIIEQPIDILFYGNISNRRIPYIEALKQLSERKNYKFIVHNNTLYNEEKILTIAISKIVVSFASDDTIACHGNDLARSSQVISSGGFIITEFIGDETVETRMSEYVPHYNTIPELINLVELYLTHPKERTKLIQLANEKFLLDFDLEKTLLEILL